MVMAAILKFQWREGGRGGREGLLSAVITCSLLCCCFDSCSCCFILVCRAAEPTTGTGMNLATETRAALRAVLIVQQRIEALFP